MQGGCRERLLKNLGASALGQVVNTAVLVLGIPVFLRLWGKHLYGEWLLLSAIPAYLTFGYVPTPRTFYDGVRSVPPGHVLTFEPVLPGFPGEIVLALGTVRREALAAGRTPAQHLAHLVVHGALHLRGYEHDDNASARHMETTEIRILRRLGFGNPYTVESGRTA